MPYSAHFTQDAKRRFRKFAGLAAGALLSAAATPAGAVTQEIIELMGRCAPEVHPATLSAVVRQESAGNPYAIGVNGKVKLKRQPRSRDEAVATARMLLSRGVDFDSGLGQVNVRNIGCLGMSIADLFDPCLNLKASATVLSDCYSRATRANIVGQPAIHAALSCYNTGSLTRGFGNGYVSKVVAKAGPSVTPTPPQTPKSDAPFGAAAAAKEVASNDIFGVGMPDAFATAKQ